MQTCPELLQQSDTIEWDEAQGTLKALRRSRIGQLTVKVQPLAKPSEEELHQAMLNGIRDKGLSVLNWTPEAEQFRLRLLRSFIEQVVNFKRHVRFLLGFSTNGIYRSVKPMALHFF